MKAGDWLRRTAEKEGLLGLMGRIVMAIIGTVMLIFSFMFSLVLLLVIVVLGIAMWIYLRWRMKKMLKMVEAMNFSSAPNPYTREKDTADIIEGESVRVSETRLRLSDERPPSNRQKHDTTQDEDDS